MDGRAVVLLELPGCVQGGFSLARPPIFPALTANWCRLDVLWLS